MPWLKAFWAFVGLVPALMFVTGVVMWWNRVLRRRPIREVEEAGRVAAAGPRARAQDQAKMRAWIVPNGCKSTEELRIVKRPDPVHGIDRRRRARACHVAELPRSGVVAGQYFGGAVTRDTVPLSDGAGDVSPSGRASRASNRATAWRRPSSNPGHHQRRSARRSTACWQSRSR